jgi:hypothetical protein
MRENPFLGQYTLKSQEMREIGGTLMESGKYGQKWYDGSSREFPSIKPIPKEDHLQGYNVNHQGEAGKKA